MLLVRPTNLVIALSCLISLTLCPASPAQTTAPKELTPGAKVEVREGDTWTPATIIKKEGRRYLIHYEDADAGEQEWVTTDRIRQRGSTDTNAAADSGASADSPPTPATKARPKFKWKIADQVEVKWGGLWFKATITKRQNDWTLIQYERHASSFEWVEPWRIRDIGSDYDTDYAAPNPSIRNNEAPPRPTVGQAPADKGKDGKDDPFAPQPFEKPVTPASREGINEILPVFDGAWNVPVDAGKPVTAQPVALSGPSDASVSSLIVSPMAAVLVYSRGRAGNQNLSIERVDLSSASARGVCDINRASLPIDLSPSGKLMLGRANGFFGGTKHRLDLWRIDQKDPKHVVSFIPYPDKSSRDGDIAWARMVDEDFALTCDWGGSLICWQVSKAQALWRLVLGNNPSIALSPSRKYIFACSDEGLLALDAASGKVVGTLPNEGRKYDDLSVSGDGKTLFGIQGSVITAFDLEKGALINEIGLPAGVPGGSVLALTDQQVLVGSYLFDMKAQSVIWQYDGANHSANEVIGGRLFYYFGSNNRAALSSAKLPHEAARKALAKTNGEPLALKPGDTVSLSVEIDAAEDERKAITNAVTSQLEKGGLRIADGAPVRLVLRTEDGKTSQQTYERIGHFGRRDVETVNVTTKITRIFYEKEGKVLWERRTESSAGNFVRAREDQSIAQAVQEASKFNTAFLKQVRVPAKVCITREPLTLGKSTLVLAGPRDD